MVLDYERVFLSSETKKINEKYSKKREEKDEAIRLKKEMEIKRQEAEKAALDQLNKGKRQVSDDEFGSGDEKKSTKKDKKRDASKKESAKEEPDRAKSKKKTEKEDANRAKSKKKTEKEGSDRANVKKTEKEGNDRANVKKTEKKK